MPEEGKVAEGKREFVRVPVAVRIGFNFVSPEEKEKIVNSINKTEEDTYRDVESLAKLIMEKHKLHETKDVNPLVLELLIYLKKRIDELAEDVQKSCEICFQNRALTNDLGGGGLSFNWKEAIEKGALLDIFIYVPLFPKSGIRALGKVVDCQGQGQEYTVRVAFEFIKEDDREDLIKFVFIKQRELLARRSLGRS